MNLKVLQNEEKMSLEVNLEQEMVSLTLPLSQCTRLTG